ncbi:redox-sensing transcriptional repressor Rex [Candidatus Dependentiae bacterium]|nr:redox-sensing transcriptional repressor Rex [Candidatus Dependentiae bacterium]
MNKKIPKNTIKRLSIYLRCLNKIFEEGVTTISSSELGDFLDLNPAQIRKDLSYFGEFGRQGLGYRIDKLRKAIKKIIGITENQNIILIGVGNLGKAILNYNILAKRGFTIVAAFDQDPELIGRIINNIGVFDIKKIKEVISGKDIKCAILTLPPDKIKIIVNDLVEIGIKGFLNFVPITLKLSKEVKIINIDFSSSLESLMYYLQNNSK